MAFKLIDIINVDNEPNIIEQIIDNMTKPKKKVGRPKGKTKDQFTITTRIELIQKFGVDKLRELANNYFETL